MLVLEVKLKNAEKVKKHLLDKGLYNKRYKPSKTKETICFPVLKKNQNIKSKFPNSKFKYKQLEKIEIKNYKNLLKKGLSKNEFNLLPSSYDVVGDIIIIQINDMLIKKEKAIAGALLRTHKNINTVLKILDSHKGEYRTQSLKYLAGAKNTITTYKEHNIKIKLDVAKAYFSPRLSTERKRIYKQVKPGEKILVMFSGVAVYPIVIAKNTLAEKIIGIEKNPVAYKYALENIEINKTRNIILIKGDVRKEIPKLKEIFDRIIMPLPKCAEDFLDLAIQVWKKDTIVHLYGFSHIDNLREIEASIKNFCNKHNVKCKILRTVICGQHSPYKYRVCVDFLIK